MVIFCLCNFWSCLPTPPPNHVKRLKVVKIRMYACLSVHASRFVANRWYLEVFRSLDTVHFNRSEHRFILYDHWFYSCYVWNNPLFMFLVGILSGGSRISREEGWALTYYYRLQTKLREDNVFTPVCYSVHKGGGLPLGRGGGYLPLVLRGYPHPTGRHCLGRHLPGQTPPEVRHTPLRQTPPAWADTPLPGQADLLP